MLAKAMGRFGEVFAVTVTIDDVVRGAAVALAGHLRGAISQELDIAGEHNLDRGIDATVALRKLLVRLVGDLRYCGTPCLPGGLLETRCTCLFPRDLTNCYHCIALCYEKGRLRPGREVFVAPHDR